MQRVIIVGNRLAVVGEQIRSRSEKTITALVKFGQSGVSADGTVYALSFFPLPQATLGITINKAVYNPVTKELAVFYENIGNQALYALTTLVIKDEDLDLT